MQTLLDWSTCIKSSAVNICARARREANYTNFQNDLRVVLVLTVLCVTCVAFLCWLVLSCNDNN